MQPRQNLGFRRLGTFEPLPRFSFNLCACATQAFKLREERCLYRLVNRPLGDEVVYLKFEAGAGPAYATESPF